jgi:hypothetical protein
MTDNCTHPEIHKGFCKKCGGALTAEEMWAHLNRDYFAQFVEQRPKKLSKATAHRMWTLDLKKDYGCPIPAILFLPCTCNGRTSLASKTRLQEKVISALWSKYLKEHPDSLYGVTPDQALEQAHAGHFLHAKPSKKFLEWLEKQYEWMKLKTGQAVKQCEGCKAIKKWFSNSSIGVRGVKKHLEDMAYNQGEERPAWQQNEIEHHTYDPEEVSKIEDFKRLQARRMRRYMFKLAKAFRDRGIELSKTGAIVTCPCLNGCGRQIWVQPWAPNTPTNWKKQPHQHKERLRKVSKGMEEWFCDDCYRGKKRRIDAERVKARRHEKALQKDIIFFKKKRKRRQRQREDRKAVIV